MLLLLILSGSFGPEADIADGSFAANEVSGNVASV
jgi:hypothetical protein